MKPTSIQCLGAGVLYLALAAFPSSAAITLTFEGLEPKTKVGDYYNGGAGVDYGIAFYTSDKAPWADGGVSYPNPPSGTMVLRSTEEYSATTCMNVSAGFLGQVAFFYSAPIHDGHLEIWSGLDGTGNLLASTDLAAIETSGPTMYDVWAPFNLSFDGVARSVHFGYNSAVAFDDISLRVVPEPASWMAGAFLLIGLAIKEVHRRIALK